jgi:hypothetical protein
LAQFCWISDRRSRFCPPVKPETQRKGGSRGIKEEPNLKTVLWYSSDGRKHFEPSHAGHFPSSASSVPLCFKVLFRDVDLLGQSQRQKILQQQPAGFRQHAFRMELHTFNREAPMAQAHDHPCAIGFMRFRADFQFPGQAFFFHDQ